MSSGEFAGIVADNPDGRINLKVFNGEVQNNHQAIKKDEERYRPLPLIEPVSSKLIIENK